MLHQKTSLDKEDLINSLVFFGATSWCVPCRNLKPTIEGLSEDYENVTFIYVDADDAPDVVAENQIRSVPTVKLFVNSEEKKVFYGALPKSQYVKELDLYFGD